MKKGFAPILILVVVVIGMIAIGAILYFQSKSKPPTSQPIPTQPQTASSSQVELPSETPAKDETANWKTYTDQNYEFSFKIPPGWSVGRSDDNDLVIQDNYGGYVAEFYKVSEKNRDIVYCDLDPQDTELCETLRTSDATIIIYWGKFTSPINKEPASAVVVRNNELVEFDIYEVDGDIVRKILSTFQFTD